MGPARFPLMVETWMSKGSSRRLPSVPRTGRSRVRYNHALALERVGRYDDSFVALQSAHQLDPRDVPILEALTINRVNREQWRDAQRYAKLLRAVAPGSVFAHQTLQRIEAMREYGLIK